MVKIVKKNKVPETRNWGLFESRSLTFDKKNLCSLTIFLQPIQDCSRPLRTMQGHSVLPLCEEDFSPFRTRNDPTRLAAGLVDGRDGPAGGRAQSGQSAILSGAQQLPSTGDIRVSSSEGAVVQMETFGLRLRGASAPEPRSPISRAALPSRDTNFVSSMRGAVLEPPAARVGSTDWIQAQLGFPDIPPSLVPLQKFSLRGELMHSYPHLNPKP